MKKKISQRERERREMQRTSNPHGIIVKSGKSQMKFYTEGSKQHDKLVLVGQIGFQV